MLRFLEARGSGRQAAWLVATGILAGLALLSRQNAGIFLLWGVSGFLASRADPVAALGKQKSGVIRLLRVGYLALIPVGAVLLVKNFLGPGTMVPFVIPLVALAMMGAQECFSRGAARALLVRLAWVVAGFLAAVGPWLVFFTLAMGLGPFLRALLFIGVDVDRNLYVPFPPPATPTLMLVIVLVLWGLFARINRNRESAGYPDTDNRPGVDARLRTLALVASTFVLGAILSEREEVVRLLRFDYGLGEVHLATGTALDNMAAYLAVLVIGAAILVAWRQRRGITRREDPSPDAFLCVLWIAACCFLQYYPRMDAAHLVTAAPLLYAVGTGLLGRTRASWTRLFSINIERYARLVFHGICVVLILFIMSVKTAPKFYSQYKLSNTDAGLRVTATPREWLRFERANIYSPVYFEADRALLSTFRALVEYIHATTTEEEPIFVFPALPMVYFVSGRDNPTRHDYFLGNNVSFRDQLEVIRTLERENVRTVVVSRDPGDYFFIRGKDFTRIIWRYLDTRYYLDRKIGPYNVMHRHGSLLSDDPEERRP
jgi:hypothetical protein